jgi:lysophospholipase L1-like esterase
VVKKIIFAYLFGHSVISGLFSFSHALAGKPLLSGRGIRPFCSQSSHWGLKSLTKAPFIPLIFAVPRRRMNSCIFTFCVIGIVSLLCFTACNNGTTDDDAVNTGTSLVCLGDSLTAGYGATTPGIDDETKSYPAYLRAKLNIPVFNAGVSGGTTSEALSRIEADVLAKDPRIVIIELGANDIRYGIFPWGTKDNLQKIIDLIDNGKRKIYLAKFYTEEVVRSMMNNFDFSNLPDYFGSFDLTDPAVQTMLITLYDNVFDELASSNNVELIEDIWSGVWGEHMSDEVHPNAQGYERMAENYYKAMEPYLEKNNLLALSLSRNGKLRFAPAFGTGF